MSIQTVEINTPDSFAVVEIRQGPAGTGGGGSATWGGITGTLSAQTDLQTALNLKAPLASPALTGTPTAPTAATTTSTTQVATTAFVQQELAAGTAVAKNLEFLAHNGSGATIAKGSIVYINGAVGGVPRITKAQGNNDTNSARTIGVVKADIADGSDGFVIIEGELQNVSTADSIGIIGAGIQLYLSPTTPGAFTRTKPSAPNHLVYVGVVVTASTGANLDGKILVGIQNGYELNEIHDVSISSPAAKQVIKRNAGNTLWVNEAIVSADVSDATNDPTPSTLVRRDASGGARFGDVETITITASGISTTGQVEFNGTDAGDSLTFNMVNYTYGAGAASAHRAALNGGAATGDALFTAATPAAARTTLELGSLATINSPLPVANGGTGTTNGSITGTGALTFTAGGSNQNINLTPTGTGIVRITKVSGQPAFQAIGASNSYPGFYAAITGETLSRVGIELDGTASNKGALFFTDGTTKSLGLSMISSGVLGIGSGAANSFAGSLKATNAEFVGTTASTSTTTGALVVAGGAGIAGAVNSLYQRVGSGTPEGVVTAPVGAVFHRTNGGAGTSFYVKESGAGNTGWVAK